MTENVVTADNRVSFELVNEAARTWKVVGCFDPQSMTYKDPPAPLTKDAVVKMDEGKFPLTDYRDNYRHGSEVIYIFTSVDRVGIGVGVRISGFLDGFTYNCTPPGFGTGGAQKIVIKIKATNPAP